MPPSGVFDRTMDEEALLEAEIAQELELINLDAGDEANNVNNNIEDFPSLEDESLDDERELPGEVSDYVKRMQEQTAAFERELAECDALLYRADSSLKESNSVVPVGGDEAMIIELARERGESPTAYRNRILEEMEKEELDLSDEPFITGDVVGLNENEEKTGVSKALVLLDERTLEFQRMFREEMNLLEKRQKEREEYLKMEIEEERKKEKQETEIKEEKWKEKFEELRREETTLKKTREVEQEKFEEEAKLREQEINVELEQFQMKLEQLEAETEQEKESFIKEKEEENKKRELLEKKSAIRIQSHYRGHVVRKQYSEILKAKEEERKKKWEEERIQQVEKELEIQREQERKRKEEEEKLKREKEEERLKKEKEEEERLEQERLRKEKEEKERLEKEKQEKEKEEARIREEKRKEEERKKEEMRKKEEEKRREEDRLREEQRKKEEAERLKLEKEMQEEEIRKQKEEEERKRLEEKKKQEEEERLRKEAEEKRKAEEKIQKAKEEKERKEAEERHHIETQRQKLEEEKNKKERLVNKSKDFVRKSQNKVPTENNTAGVIKDKTFVSGRSTDKTFVLNDGGNQEEDSDGDQDLDIDLQKRNKAVNLMLDGLPQSLEGKRLQWIKDCRPWSKISNEPWKLKASSTKRAVRRPSSAKKLSPLDEQIILSAAHADTLRQVSTVELHDLPGTSITTLGQCWGLKHLTMNNCNLTVIEGLQQCKQLQSVDFKDNFIEYIDLKDLGNISYMDLSRNKISVIHGLAGCTNVRWLDLSHNRITRLGGLDALRRLHTLNLSHNQLITTSCMNDTPTVQKLDLSHNHLQKLEDLDKLCLLQSLNVSANNLLQFPVLHNHVLLQEIILEDNSITVLDELRNLWLPLLHNLNVSQNSIEELISLECFHILRTLDVSTNQILDPDNLLESICSCSFLESISVSSNPAVEGSQLKLSEKLPRLCCIDGASIKTPPTPLKPSNGFQAMCVSQVQLFQDINNRFQQDLKNVQNRAPLDISSLCDIYFNFCDKSNKIASDHRYTHEYGDITMAMPTAPSTPKSSRPRSSRSTRVLHKDETYTNPKDMFNQVVSSGVKELTKSSDVKYSNPKDMFNQAVSSLTKNSGTSDVNYSNPKDMFEKALHGDTNIESSPKLQNADSVSRKLQNGFNSEKTVVISAKTVQDLMSKDNRHTKPRGSALENAAATKIQAVWRGYSLRKYLYGDHDDDEANTSDMAVLQELHKAATKIQAVWRGFILRLRLERAIEFARFHEDDDEDFQEVNMADFNFDEDVLDDWRPPTTPQLPQSHPVLGKPPSGKQRSPLGRVPSLDLANKQLPPVKPQRAWRGMDSPLSDIHQNGHMPHPPPSVTSGADTHRTAVSKKEELLSEEWGFKDTNTAHLMMQRAKKMKYNSERRKKLSKLDPKQRLALFRRLEETNTVRKPIYQPPAKQTLPRKEYFQARHEEMERQDLEKRVMQNMKNNRTYEWIHTQVGDHEITDSTINQRKPVRNRYGSEGNLPRMDPDVTAGRPARLVASPSMDVMSVDSVSLQGEMIQPRRMSVGSDASGMGRFPPIKTSSAGSSHSVGSRRREKISWRNKEVNKSIGWGGGKKRSGIKD